jgi:flagellar basal body P-ring formation protein FlgA
MRLWVVASVFVAGIAQAQGYPQGISGAEVGRLVRAAMAKAGVTPADLADPVRGFPPCAQAPTVIPSGGRWTTALIRCDGTGGWTRAIRTGAASTARDPEARSIVADGPLAAVLTRSLPRGAMIGPGDVIMRPAAGHGPGQIFTDPAQVIGRRLKTSLGVGNPLLLRHLTPVWLIAEGTPVALLATAGGLAVSAPAQALENGGMGDAIRVLNLSSQREVRAVVTGANSVTAQTNMR